MKGCPSCSSIAWTVQIPGWLSSRGRFGLAPEAREGVRVPGQLRGQELEGHVAPELRVLGFVHDAHAPAAELRRDPVVGDFAADHRCVLPRDGRGCYQKASLLTTKGIRFGSPP